MSSANITASVNDIHSIETNLITTVLGYAVDLFMIIGPAASFFIQIGKIKQMNSSEGFSKLIILILLIANILRIYFWFGKHFSETLLIQSFLMILTQLYLLYICLIYSNSYKEMVKSSSKDMIEKSTKISVFRLTPPNLSRFKDFWQWNHFSDYIYFLVLFITVIGVLSRMIGFDNPHYVESLGFFSMGIESTLGIPQVLSNYLEKSTGSLSIAMIFFWLFGDSFKTTYFVMKSQPQQFIFCGTVQLISDFIIVFQILYYSQGKVDKDRDDISTYSGKSYKKVNYHKLSEDSSDNKENANMLSVDDEIAVSI